MRVGLGYDIHRLEPGRALRLGGVQVASPVGSVAHSDGDCLLHALIDALLGAAGLGDIGSHFPSSDARWKDADSAGMVARVRGMLDFARWRVENVDSTVILESPRLATYLPPMRQSIAGLLGIEVQQVSVKAKTNDGVGALGDGMAVAAQVVALIERRAD